MTMINSVNAMKKTYLMMAGTVLVCTLVACNKEQEVKEETNPENEVELVTEVIRASWDEGETKGNIAEVGGAFTWSKGDKIAVHTNNDGGTWYYSQALVAGDEGQISANFTTTFAGTRDAVAVFPNSLVTEGADALSSGLTVTLPSSYRLADVLGDKAPTPMVADNTQDVLSFKHLCGLLRLTINGIPAEATKLTVDFLGRQVHGDFTIAAGNLTPGDAACIISTTTPSANDVITITNLDGSASVTVNIPLPAGTYDDVVITPYNGDDALKLMAVRHIKGGSYTASRAHRRKLTATLVSFSVSAEKKVIFSPGNLVYDNGNWRFHANQYDRCFTEDGDVSSHYTSTGTFDLFGWGTSGWSGSGVESWTNYQPWATSNTNLWITGGSGTPEDPYVYNNTFENNVYGYGPDYPNSLTGTYAKGDWGVYNQIGDYPAGTWRTPTYLTGGDGEWDYLIFYRDGHDTKWNQGTVENVQGLIILPDNFVDPETNESSKGGPSFYTASNNGFSYNKYSGSNWEAMESAGAVFLPGEGIRQSTSVSNIGTKGNYGYYWSSSASDNGNANRLVFRGNKCGIGSKPHHQGYSVRLVRDL